MSRGGLGHWESGHWERLFEAPARDWESGTALVAALEVWAGSHQATAAALFARGEEGSWRRLPCDALGAALPGPGVAEGVDGARSIALADDCTLIWLAAEPEGIAASSSPRDGEGLLLLTAARLLLLHERLRDEEFQENYRVLTLEALYDVGLAVASTLELEQLYEEILPRAVSLLDARRGALYLRQNGEFRLQKTIGGAARERADASVLEQGEELGLLPAACHTLAVPMKVDQAVTGLLVVADKESRTGVGPFLPGDLRALNLFATQAAIALENARLHREALEKQRLEREMELAAEIQRGILPACMVAPAGLETVGWNRPTRQVGGDYFTSLALPGGGLGLVVADVTGKGMPAALLVSTLHSALRLLLDSGAPGVELLAKLNQHIAESSGSNKFITMIMLEVDAEGGKLGYVNAGHNPGLLVRRDGTVEELSPGGLPLGLLPRSTYRHGELALHPGDLVCLYSDGITECASRDDEEYGIERLRRYLVAQRAAPLAEILDGLEREVTKFAGDLPQGDDQTVVLLRRLLLP